MLKTTKRVSAFGIMIGGALALTAACGGGDAVFGDGNGGNGGSGAGLGVDDCREAGQTCNDVCDLDLGCVECGSDADCGAGNPICIAGECRECGDNADCATGQSCFPEDGTC